MKARNNVWKLITTSLLVGLTYCSTILCSNAASIKGQAVVVALSGAADYSRNGRDWFPIQSGKPLAAGTHIRTAKRSWVDLYLNHNGPAMRINEDSHLVLDRLDREEKGNEVITDTLLSLKDGSVAGYTKSTSPNSKFVINTTPDAATIAALNKSFPANQTASTTLSQSSATAPTTMSVSFTPTVRQPIAGLTKSVSSANGGAVMSPTIHGIDGLNDGAKYYVKFNGFVTVDENSYVGVDVRYSPLGNVGLGSITHVLPGMTYDPTTNTQHPTGPTDITSLIATIDTVIGNTRTFTLSKGAKVQVTPVSP